MSDLRKALIRLAYEKPGLRGDLLPLLKTAARIRMAPGRADAKFTGALATAKLKARNRGDFDSAIKSAGHYAKKLNSTMYLYQGNSYGHSVWRVSGKPGEYLDPINNTGNTVLSVTPDLVVSRHALERPF
jgi:hypothetical protein